MIRTLATVLVSLALAASASAQNTERWVHPTGAYSLAPEAAGWALLPSLSDERSASFELVGEDRLVRECSASSRLFPAGVTLTQELINERTEAFTPSLEQGAISDVSTSAIDGVVVKAFRLDLRGGSVVIFYRIFGLVEDHQITFNELSCGGGSPVSAEHQAAFERFFASLRISPGSTL
jgi:hypothetical protein